ncbi:MAG TPA: hypothetical protein VGL78_05665 [Solirubrobacteraceae bacterium]|jgi:hypothetical protein
MLTIIVTAGGVGVAAAASAIGDLHVSGSRPGIVTSRPLDSGRCLSGS